MPAKTPEKTIPLEEIHEDFLTHHYAALIKDADDAIISKDLNGVVTSWNKAAESIFGYSAAEMIGRPISTLFPPDNIEENSCIFNSILQGTQAHCYFTTQVLHKNGKRVDVAVTVSPVKNSNGEIIGASKIARRIHDEPMILASTAHTIHDIDHYAAIIESSEDAIISKSLTGVVMTWNKAAEKIFGYTSAEMVGQPMTKVFPEALYDEERIILAKISNGERIKHFRTQRLTKHQKTIDVSVTISPIKDEMGNIVGASKIARDITDLVLKEKLTFELAIRSSHFSAIVESSDDAIISKTLEGTVTSWNRAAELMFGYKADEILGKPMTHIFPLDRMHEEEVILSEISRGRKVDHFQTVRLHKDGREVSVSVTISPIIDADGKVIGASKIARDITEKVAAERKLWQLANYDHLTQLPNRRLFMDRLEMEIMRARRTQESFSVMYLDLDRFKQVNDIHGHATGDQLLIEVSQRLRTCFREADTVARLGGDEFAALLPGLYHAEDVLTIATKIQHTLQAPVQIRENTLTIGVSIGTSIFPDHGNSVEELLHHSDLHMYQAKAARKSIHPT